MTPKMWRLEEEALDEDAFTVEVEGETFTGTLADGVIVLDMMGMNMTFEKGE